MINTKNIIGAIDDFITSVDHKLTAYELQQLHDIKLALAKQTSLEEIQKYLIELVKLMVLFKDFFDK